MCGLIGYSGKSPANPMDFNVIMKDNDSRGGHSSGFYNGDVFEKCIGTTESLHNEIKNGMSKLLIGHTRYATHGEHTIDNQHPFQYGKIVGAHNGVLSNYKEVGKKFDLPETTVDSQMIFQVLNHTKDFNTLGMFSGTLATLFQDLDNQQYIYAYRRGNPLYVGKTKDGAYFSSLIEPLETIGIESKDIWQLKERKLYKFENGRVVDTTSIDNNPVPSTKVVDTDWRSYGSLSTRATKQTAIDYNTDYYYNSYGTANIETESVAFHDEVEKIEKMIKSLDEIMFTYGPHMKGEEIEHLENLQDYLQCQLTDWYY
jgi:glucosamine 6-phosphate synthetase-like amidotransferase/phosphosugar isomerase protein